MAQSTVAPNVRRHSSAGLFVSLLLPFAILATVGAYGLLRSSDSTNLPQPGSRGALVWGNGIFASRVEMKAWLNLHGGGYRAWARRHPAALRLVPRKSRVAHHAAHKVSHVQLVKRTKHTALKHTAAPKRAAPARRAASVATRVAAGRAPPSAGTNLMLWLLVVIGVLLAGAAAAPRWLFRPLHLHGLWEERELRIGTAAAGVALLVGIAIATQLT